MLDVTKYTDEVPQLDMEVHESPVKARKHICSTKNARERGLSLDISTLDKLQRDPPHRIDKDQNSFPENSKALSLQENSYIPELQKIAGLEENPDTPAVSVDDSETRSKLHPDSSASQPFNLQEELDKMASLDEINQIAKMENEMNIPDKLKERKNIVNCEDIGPTPVEDLNMQTNKTARLPSSDTNENQPFDWQAEMNTRVKLKGKTYGCVECGFKARGNGTMINHLEIYHMKNITGFKCPDCDSVCDTFLTFNEHMKIAHKVKLSLLQKDIEEKKEEKKLVEKNALSFINASIEVLQTSRRRSFNWEEEVKRMTRRVSKDSRLVGISGLYCALCDFSSSDSLGGQKSLLTHIETNHMENLLGFRCSKCDVLYQTFVIFNQHMNISHRVHLNLLQNGSLFLK